MNYKRVSFQNEMYQPLITHPLKSTPWFIVTSASLSKIAASSTDNIASVAFFRVLNTERALLMQMFAQMGLTGAFTAIYLQAYLMFQKGNIF